jgi:5-methylcytosine-specific restriction protein A
MHARERQHARYQRQGYVLYDRKWKRESKAYLAAHQRCVDCGGKATVVDHDTPHKGDTVRFWDVSNWRSRCKPCHDRKTAARDGSFGRSTRYGGLRSP